MISSENFRFAISVAATALVWLFAVGLGQVRAEPLSAFIVEQVATSVRVEQQSKLCLMALRRVEQRYHLPRALLASVALAESGRAIKSLGEVRPWPWTINADGTGLFLESKAAAITWMQDQAAGHDFVDVGCMQVDLHYHPNAFASMEEAFDPYTNADYAARLLVHLHGGEAAGRWDIAVGLYHSHTSSLAAEFRNRVALLGAHGLHATLKAEPGNVHASNQGAAQLILTNGRLTPNNALHPAIKAGHRHIPCQPVEILYTNPRSTRLGAGCFKGMRQ